jgi:hypothetical protein
MGYHGSRIRRRETETDLWLSIPLLFTQPAMGLIHPFHRIDMLLQLTWDHGHGETRYTNI